MKKVLEQIHQMEDRYIRLFSESEETINKIVYADSLIPDMYSHNFIYYKNIDTMKEELLLLLKDFKEDFLRVVFPGEAKEEYLHHIELSPTIIEYDVYLIKSEQYVDLSINEDVSVLKVTNDDLLRDAIRADVEANKEAMGLDFTTRRMLRKAINYMDQTKAIDAYLAYDKDEPVGTVDFAYHEGIAKIEDFDVLKTHQKKGIGTTMIRKLLKDAYEKEIDYVYLLTDHSETAKEMYEKCGFELVDKKTEYFFQKKA